MGELQHLPSCAAWLRLILFALVINPQLPRGCLLGLPQCRLGLAISCHPNLGAAPGPGHCHLLALTTFCRNSRGCQMESGQGKTPAAGVQKPPLRWAICAANQHGAAGRAEGAAAWQGGCTAGRRGTLGCPVQGHAQADSDTSCKRWDYDPPHKRIWDQILSQLSQRGWSSAEGRCPS